ncbi:MAG: C69 family dipeptidase [Muribaculaceae bacterium]|nr:C69 family dipeptidase [Muribaculaceae bacterium]
MALMGVALMSVRADACTNLLVGKAASADGSTIISYAADSHTLYGDMQFLPAADHKPGEMREIRDWDTGKLHGSIPEVAHTYQVIGNINEHQLTIAESTWGGRLELMDTTGNAIMDYGSLIYVALQRAKTAREAITVMTDLVEKYGYNSEGESFSIGDPNEIWIMDMIGKAGKEKGAVWVAMRLPDDCISGHANQARIYKFPLNDKENCIYSKDVISFARKMGLYKGKDADFEFSTVYAPADFGTLRGCDARVWSYFNRFAAGMDRYLPFIAGKKGAEIMPVWVKPDRKVSVRDVQNMMRDHFEDTPFDMTKDPGATNYWGVPYRWRPMEFKVDSTTYCMERAIATQQTGFVFVNQMRSWLPDAIGGVTGFGVDDANTAVFVPVYCCSTEVPDSYARGKADLYTFNFDAAFWVNNLIANFVYSRYSVMIGDVKQVQAELEDKFEKNQPVAEVAAQALYKQNPAGAVEYLTNYSVNNAQKATKRYQDLAKYLFVKYMDGNVKKEKDGQFQRNADGTPVQPSWPGYTQEYYNTVVAGSGDRLKVVEPEK